MKWVRKAAKIAALPAGLVRRRRPGDVVMLLYHRIRPGSAEIELSPAVFERQLVWLKENDQILTLERALEPDAGGGLVVTFDDGTRDLHEHALPTLIGFQVPAVLYLATGSVQNGGGRGGDGLTWSQVAELVSTGLVTVGSHTHGHRALSRAPEHAAEEEMRRSKELIEDHLGIACRHFSYPFAVGSPGADRAARRLFDTAALDAWRTNRANRIDPYRLGRTPVLRSDDHVFFVAKVRGLLDAEAFAYRALGRGPWRWR